MLWLKDAWNFPDSPDGQAGVGVAGSEGSAAALQ